MILGRFVVIPTGFPNTNIETSYAFLALISAIFGPFAGLIMDQSDTLLKISRHTVVLGGVGLFVQEL